MGGAMRRPARFRVRDVVPRFPDYVRCLALMAIPAVATTMAIIFLRTATNGVQSSLYVVYLNGVGLTGTSIGILFAAIEVMSGLGSLFAGRASRLGDPQRTMLSGTVLSIVLICVTPFLGGIFALLLLAQAARGWLQGVVQPHDVLGPSQGRRALPAGVSRGAAADDEPARGDRDPADYGLDRRPLGGRRELRYTGRPAAFALRAYRTDRPPRGAPTAARTHAGRLTGRAR